MALNEWQRQQRRRYIGSSDAAAVVGKDPWRSAFDLWAEKTGRLNGKREEKPQYAVGTYLEEGILRWAADQLGRSFRRDIFRAHGNGVACANWDALDPMGVPPIMVEAKHAGIVGTPTRYSLDDFGEPGTDVVPQHILIQVQHQFLVAEDQEDFPPYDWCIVPALLVRRGFVMYRVPRSQALVDVLREQQERFWQDFVLADRPPPDTIATPETLRRLIREPGTSVPVDDSLVRDWLLAKEVARITKGREAEAQATLLTALGDAELGTASDGAVTYLETKRAAYSVEAQTYRTLRFKQTPQRRRGAS